MLRKTTPKLNNPDNNSLNLYVYVSSSIKKTYYIPYNHFQGSKEFAMIVKLPTLITPKYIVYLHLILLYKRFLFLFYFCIVVVESLYR